MKILVIEDHPVSALGLEKLLRESFNAPNILIAEDGRSARKLNAEHDFSLAVMDIMIPKTDTHALLRELLRVSENLKILVYSSCKAEIYAPQYLCAGVNGYIHKSCTSAAFSLAVQTVMSGGCYLPPDCAHLLRGFSSKDKFNPFERLSSRELEVSTHLLEGKSVKEICEILNLESSTVGTQKSRLFQKLGVSNLIDFYKTARGYGLVE